MDKRKRVHRSGVDFDCEKCGKLLRDCRKHNKPERKACPECDGDLVKVGIGNKVVGFAVWLRCADCSGLFMRRRGEMVATKPRSGFEEFT